MNPDESVEPFVAGVVHIDVAVNESPEDLGIALRNPDVDVETRRHEPRVGLRAAVNRRARLSPALPAGRSC
jgi:hypothetical protein